LKVNPLGDRVLVKPNEQAEQIKGGIIIPDTAKEKPQEGTIIAVGPGKNSDTGSKIAMTVKVNDIVLYGKYAGTEIRVNDDDLLMMSESDILAIVEK
jgi:chaperonin GroES